MVFSLTWLPAILEGAGLKIAEVNGWRTRGRAEMGRVRGVICHHTVGARTGNMPSLDLLVSGRADLPGPLAQLGLGRDGTYYVIAAGRCNHAGKGRWRGIDTGNSNFIGIEAENAGTAQDPWPEVQLDAYRRGVAAILSHAGADASMCCGHKEYALPAGRKSDPLFDMAAFRDAVRAIMAGQVPPPAPIPAVDAKSRPTLRRGAQGDLVRIIQAKLALEADGRFGSDTEAAVRQFQREQALVPDGIVGPRSWAALDAKPAATGAGHGAQPAAIRPIPTTPPVPAPGVAAPVTGDLPPADDATRRVSLRGANAVSPDGRVFARATRKGFATTGETSLARWLGALPAPPAGISSSVARVVRAVCVNEGGLEAINSYDGCFMSVGIFQWTAGLGSDPGELPVLLSRFKAASPGAYEECFGRFRLEAQASPGATTGSLVLDGRKLDTAAEKEQLRKPEWAYRFWRAGHHHDLRATQLALAASRIGRFIDKPAHDRPIRDWLNSEYAVALILDEHVNRPGHVPGTLEAALHGLYGSKIGAQDPGKWTEHDEARLIDAYLDARAETSMTDSSKRAQRVGECVRTGQLSDDRSSFVATAG